MRRTIRLRGCRRSRGAGRRARRLGALRASLVAAPAPENDPATQRYRAALSALERRLPDAISAFDRFVREHPAHPYADNAMYWRAVRLRAATTLARWRLLRPHPGCFPHGNKVPDALLRIGLCYERMGQRERARRVFSRLRQQYPDTVAARMASREDA
ncbi:MAG: tetratricopeptide repeat protein [Sandaracinaceae bacterium]